MIYLFLTNGFEECEALAPLDILRRGNIEIKTVGIGTKIVEGSHGIKVTADIEENEVDLNDNLKGIILPGGLPGAVNLENSETVQKAIDYCNEKNLLISAICAAPQILGHKNLLNGKKATCYTGFESELYGADVQNLPVVADGNIITAYGAGAAFEFGFQLLKYFTSEEISNNMKKQMRYIG